MKHSFLLVLAITAVSAQAVHKKPLHADSTINRMLSDMKRDIQNMTKKIDRLFSDDVSVTNKKMKNFMKIDTNDAQVMLSFMLGKGLEHFDAELEDDKLSIKIPARYMKITMKYNKKNNYLSVETKWSVKRSGQKDTIQEHYESEETVHHGQTIEQPLVFKKATVAYENGALQVTIPTLAPKKKHSKKLDVEIK